MENLLNDHLYLSLSDNQTDNKFNHDQSNE